MPNKVEIKSIVLTVDDKDIAMTVEQARMLKIQLEGLFGKEEAAAIDLTVKQIEDGKIKAKSKALSLLVQRLCVNDTHL